MKWGGGMRTWIIVLWAPPSALSANMAVSSAHMWASDSSHPSICFCLVVNFSSPFLSSPSVNT